MLEPRFGSHLFLAFGTDSLFDGFGGSEHPSTSAASSFMLYGVTIGNGFVVRDYLDSPSDDFDGGGIFFEL